MGKSLKKKADEVGQDLKALLAAQTQETLTKCGTEIQAVLDKYGCTLGCSIQAIYDPASGVTRHVGSPSITLKPE
jgi:hypothetical protein